MFETSTPIVYVVDEDTSVRDSLRILIQNAGLQSETFATAGDFLAHPKCANPCCLVLNMSLPDLNGLELQERVASERRDMQFIFLAARADIPTTVQAMKRGALEFLMKPFDSELLLAIIRYALTRSEAIRRRESELHSLRADYGSLSAREQEVMRLVVSGMLNKQIGAELGISEITVKAHRGRVMRKMKADSLARLVSIALRLRLVPQLLATAA